MTKPTIASLQTEIKQLIAENKKLKGNNQSNNSADSASDSANKKSDPALTLHYLIKENHELISSCFSHNGRLAHAVGMLNGNYPKPTEAKETPPREGAVGAMLDMRERLGNLCVFLNENTSNLESAIG